MFPKKGLPEKEDGYTIAKAHHEGTGEEIVIKGKYGPVVDGQLLKVLRYSWRRDPRYGDYCQIWSVSHEDPITREAVVHYLKNLPGVGDKIAEAIVDDLGPDCLQQIDQDPDLLLRIKASGRGISPAALEGIKAEWETLRAERKNMLYFSSLGIGDSTGKKIAKHFYGQNMQQMIAEDPYCLCEVDGVGFKIADRVALKMGVGADDPRRAGAGVEYLLQCAERDGHICLSREEVLQEVPKLLDRNGNRPTAKTIEEGIDKMLSAGRLWSETDTEDQIERFYTREHLIIETRLYEQLETRLNDMPDEPPLGLERREDAVVTEEQWGAVTNGFSERLSILTGSAGCGKTTALKTFLDELDNHNHSYVCLAPTGKAAKRMKESTGRSAQTIHRLLGWNALNAPVSLHERVAEHEQIPADVIIVDEASMLDMRVAERLFSHARPEARVVLVGDPHQLPAVGAGSVLHDLIESDRVPTTKLTKIFRQAESSMLVVNANKIRQGQEPFWDKDEAETALGHPVNDDWVFIETEDPHEALSRTLELVDKLPDEMGIRQDQIMVTAPMKRGDAGVFVLNKALQRKRNPDGYQIRSGDQPLRVGDMVMNTVNRYDGGTDVMNGDQGKITGYDQDRKTVSVDFGFDDDVLFSNDQIEALIPAYAATTHKLQGSEAPALIAPLVGAGGSRLLTRNMLYTGWTRGREKCVVIGSKDKIREAIKHDGTKRKSTLDLRVGRILPRIKARWEQAARLWADTPDEILY